MPFYRRTWFLILVVGFALFFVGQEIIRNTGDSSLFPAVIVIGAFTLPAAFVAYIFQYERNVDSAVHRIPTLRILECFLIGGIIGIIIASAIEFGTLSAMGVPQLFGVGLIEESAKLIFPVILFIRASYTSEADGVLFGVASGMGFAALETVGYGFSDFLRSQGDINSVVQVLMIRGLLSPAGHAAWTGLVSGMLWRERKHAGHFVLSVPLIGMFILAIVLHTLWDIVSLSGVPGFIAILGYLVLAAISLRLLVGRLREARVHARL